LTLSTTSSVNTLNSVSDAMFSRALRMDSYPTESTRSKSSLSTSSLSME
jgi:hypothetical protein